VSIRDIDEALRLEQFAEECAEGSHAALKLVRALKGGNPTPVTEKAAREALREEIADVLVCIYAITGRADMEDINARCVAKMARWEGRINGTSNG